MSLTLDQLEQQVLISQITDSYTRVALSRNITSFNKEAKKAGTQQMNTEYLLRKRLPSFAAFLESAGIDLSTDLHNNLRIAFANTDVHISSSVDRNIVAKNYGTASYTSLYSIFARDFLKDGMSFKIFNNVYKAVTLSSGHFPALTLEGRTDIINLDLYKFFILLEEI